MISCDFKWLLNSNDSRYFRRYQKNSSDTTSIELKWLDILRDFSVFWRFQKISENFRRIQMTWSDFKRFQVTSHISHCKRISIELRKYWSKYAQFNIFMNQIIFSSFKKMYLSQENKNSWFIQFLLRQEYAWLHKMTISRLNSILPNQSKLSNKNSDLLNWLIK